MSVFLQEKLMISKKLMKKNQISPSISILDALRLMDEINKKLLFVVEKNDKFIGVISLGDIQRAIIKEISLETPVKNIMRDIITIAKDCQSTDEIRQMMLEKRTEAMPVINSDGKLVKVFYWEDFFSSGSFQEIKSINLPVVIMAGGVGSRLKPLTNVIPKPLIPINEKTIIEEIIDSFLKYSCSNFFITVNYRYEILKYYIDNNVIKNNIDVSYIREEKPLGTAGSLRLLRDKIKTTFFVSNCDILIDQDYSEILDYHKDNKNVLTVVAAMKNYSIPYGTLETGKDGLLTKITEKPEITFKINTGFYILEPELMDIIPDDKVFHITDLIKTLKENNKRVGVFPVTEKSWRDIGDWSEYLKLLNR